MNYGDCDMAFHEETIPLPVRDGRSGSAVLCFPEGPPVGILVLGHGIANDREHPLLAGTARRLAPRGVATLRFNYPFKEAGERDLDPGDVLMATVGRAVEAARERFGDLPVAAGGKSLSARITAAWQARGGDAAGLVYLGFPLHRPGQPDKRADRNLYRIREPQLFLAGDSDPYCHLDVLEDVLERIEGPKRLHVIPGAGHDLGVGNSEPDEAGRKQLAELAGWIASFLEDMLGWPLPREGTG